MIDARTTEEFQEEARRRWDDCDHNPLTVLKELDLDDPKWTNINSDEKEELMMCLRRADAHTVMSVAAFLGWHPKEYCMVIHREAWRPPSGGDTSIIQHCLDHIRAYPCVDIDASLMKQILGVLGLR